MTIEEAVEYFKKIGYTEKKEEDVIYLTKEGRELWMTKTPKGRLQITATNEVSMVSVIFDDIKQFTVAEKIYSHMLLEGKIVGLVYDVL